MNAASVSPANLTITPRDVTVKFSLPLP